jgi:uridine kinase
LDNYFVDRESTPLDEFGNYDFENINALNREKLNDDIRRLIQGKPCHIPKFNFIDGSSEPGEEIQLRSDQIIILEGIHGLNPALLDNRVSTTDTRLIRRIVRDARNRGYTPQETIQRWESVRRGEKKYIFPYQENADVMFNSALVYELAALKSAAEPLLRQVPFGTPEHIEIKRLLALFEWFLPIDTEFIPDNSLLREFLGGSILKDFKLWNHRSSD